MWEVLLYQLVAWTLLNKIGGIQVKNTFAKNLALISMAHDDSTII